MHFHIFPIDYKNGKCIIAVKPLALLQLGMLPLPGDDLENLK